MFKAAGLLTYSPWLAPSHWETELIAARIHHDGDDKCLASDPRFGELQTSLFTIPLICLKLCDFYDGLLIYLIFLLCFPSTNWPGTCPGKTESRQGLLACDRHHERPNLSHNAVSHEQLGPSQSTWNIFYKQKYQKISGYFIGLTSRTSIKSPVSRTSQFT